jgi:hypothetical protein
MLLPDLATKRDVTAAVRLLTVRFVWIIGSVALVLCCLALRLT